MHVSCAIPFLLRWLLFNVTCMILSALSAGRTDAEVQQLCDGIMHVLASLEAAGTAAAAPLAQTLSESAAVPPPLLPDAQSSPLLFAAAQPAPLEAQCASQSPLLALLFENATMQRYPANRA